MQHLTIRTRFKIYVIFIILLIALASLLCWLQFNAFVWIGTLIFFLGVGTSIFIIRSIINPITDLKKEIEIISSGNLDHRIEAHGDDELTELGFAINNMVSQWSTLHAKQKQTLHEQTQLLQREAKQLENNVAIIKEIAPILNLNTLLNHVTKRIHETYNYEHVGIFLVDDKEEYVSTPPLKQNIKKEGVIDWVINHQESLCIKNACYDSRYVAQEKISNINSVLALPLISGDNLLGVLIFHSQIVDTFQTKYISIFQLLADQIAIAIENAIRYQRQTIRRHFAETLQRAGRTLSRTLDLQEVLDLIMEHIAEIVPYDRAAILLREEDELCFVASRGFPESMDLNVRIPIHEEEGTEGIFQQIYRTQTPLALTDVLERPDWQQVEGLPSARSWLGLPLVQVNEVIGLLSLTREVSNAYGPEEIEVALVFADQATIALENARLYNRITHLTYELEEEVQNRTEELHVANNQLAHLNQIKSDFISIASHELRTPLTVINGYTQMLIRDETIGKNPFHSEISSIIYDNAVRLEEVITSMADVAKIDSRSLEIYPEPTSLEFLINKVCRQFDEALTKRKQTLVIKNLEDLPSIEVDAKVLKKVFYNLISNAIKYTPDEGLITVSGRILPNGKYGMPPDSVEITVEDTGIGIDPAFQELIFTKFYQIGEIMLHSTGKTKFKGHGPGLGLVIARGIVEAHHGKIWAVSPGYDEKTLPGSCFCMVLPHHRTL